MTSNTPAPMAAIGARVPLISEVTADTSIAAKEEPATKAKARGENLNKFFIFKSKKNTFEMSVFTVSAKGANAKINKFYRENNFSRNLRMMILDNFDKHCDNARRQS